MKFEAGSAPAPPPRAGPRRAAGRIRGRRPARRAAGRARAARGGLPAGAGRFFWGTMAAVGFRGGAFLRSDNETRAGAKHTNRRPPRRAGGGERPRRGRGARGRGAPRPRLRPRRPRRAAEGGGLWGGGGGGRRPPGLQVGLSNSLRACCARRAWGIIKPCVLPALHRNQALAKTGARARRPRPRRAGAAAGGARAHVAGAARPPRRRPRPGASNSCSNSDHIETAGRERSTAAAGRRGRRAIPPAERAPPPPRGVGGPISRSRIAISDHQITAARPRRALRRP